MHQNFSAEQNLSVMMRILMRPILCSQGEERRMRVANSRIAGIPRACNAAIPFHRIYTPSTISCKTEKSSLKYEVGTIKRRQFPEVNGKSVHVSYGDTTKHLQKNYADRNPESVSNAILLDLGF